jgi:NAD(P)-dependent dehydrogenase (short-subunit alcohol dehydrogenase family)
MQMSKPTERVALIVRAGNELGQKLASELARAGVRIALNDLLPDRVDQIATQIKSSGGVATVHPVDLTRKLALQTMLQDILDVWERIDILIFIANVQPGDALLDMDEWDWHRALDQNLTAAFLCTQSVGRVMRETGGGTIIFVLAGDRTKSSITYETSAAGLQALSEAAAPELAEANIQILTFKVQEGIAEQIMRFCKLSALVNKHHK